jgi:hypothetical protein
MQHAGTTQQMDDDLTCTETLLAVCRYVLLASKNLSKFGTVGSRAVVDICIVYATTQTKHYVCETLTLVLSST